MNTTLRGTLGLCSSRLHKFGSSSSHSVGVVDGGTILVSLYHQHSVTRGEGKVINRVKERETRLGYLAHERSGTDGAKKSAVFIHGILGSKRNFRTPIKSFLNKYKDFKCVSFDHRGHGESGSSFESPHTVEECAKDLKKSMKRLEIDPPNILFAHSYGGKVQNIVPFLRMIMIIPRTY